MMRKLITLLSCLVLFANSSLTFAQFSPVELKKNPFSQPNFLKYRPPVKIRVDKQKIQQEVPEFILTATFISINGPMAVVNDNLLTIGEQIDGIKLIMVGEDKVRIRYEKKYYDIPIKEFPSSQTKNIRRNVLK